MVCNAISSFPNRYRPRDMKHTEASALLSSVRKEGGNQTSLLLKAFVDIQKRFKPVMRHFFTELHKAPTAWFAIRLNYARSVATTSIVGHVLGLGDRHTSNILMDNTSGEVVHIDLGIAFDQVRCSLLCVFPLCRSSKRENFCPSQSGYLFVLPVTWSMDLGYLVFRGCSSAVPKRHYEF